MNQQVLNRGEVQSFQGQGGEVIRCQNGSLWLTVEGEVSDIILSMGEIWRLTRQGKVVVQSLTERSSFRLEGTPARQSQVSPGWLQSLWLQAGRS